MKINSQLKGGNKMKKVALGIMTTVLLLLFVPMQSEAKAIDNPFKLLKEKAEISVEAKAMVSRLEEIKLMDFSKMNSSEKKELRTEVKMLKSELQAQQLNSSGGIYISVGAAILIVLLLILLL
jgi:ABC-type transport system involved in cytochrome bd biosynthesis fused ATPase/permease subunit